MVLLPLLCFGIIVSVFSMQKFTSTIHQEVELELKNIAVSVTNALDVMYPGDYQMHGKEKIAISKGEKVINGDYELIDRIKLQTDTDITVFYSNTRILTTICNDAGERIIGTTARNVIVKQVIDGNDNKFYSNAIIDGKQYFAYYAPIQNEDGSCIGMIAVAKSASAVNQRIRQAIYPIVIISVITIIIAAIVTLWYSRNIISVIKKIMFFLNRTAEGDFKCELSNEVAKRNDEFGKMGNLAVDMQKSICNLVEKDSLTGINNRRYGDRYLLQIWNKNYETGIPYVVAIGDIDHFKNVNDTYGHECGDLVLKEIAMILKRNMTGKGFVARWGGEEFLLVFEKSGLEEAVLIMNAVLKQIRTCNVIYDHNEINVTMTVGMIEGTHDMPVHTLIKEADEKLYQGKQNGRNRVVY